MSTLTRYNPTTDLAFVDPFNFFDNWMTPFVPMRSLRNIDRELHGMIFGRRNNCALHDDFLKVGYTDFEVIVAESSRLKALFDCSFRLEESRGCA